MKKALSILAIALMLAVLAVSCSMNRHTCPAYRGSVSQNVEVSE